MSKDESAQHSEYYQGTGVRREHLYPAWARVRWWQGQVRFQSIERLLEERGYAKEDA